MERFTGRRQHKVPKFSRSKSQGVLGMWVPRCLSDLVHAFISSSIATPWNWPSSKDRGACSGVANVRGCSFQAHPNANFSTPRNNARRYWTSNPTWQTCEQIDLKARRNNTESPEAAGSMRATKCIQPNRTTKSCTLHRDSTPSTHIRDNVHPKSCLHAKCYFPVACTTFDTITNGQDAVRTPAAYNAALTGRIQFFCTYMAT